MQVRFDSRMLCQKLRENGSKLFAPALPSRFSHRKISDVALPHIRPPLSNNDVPTRNMFGIAAPAPEIGCG